MRFKIGSVNSGQAQSSTSLLFEMEQDRLIALGPADTRFDAIVQSFNPTRDIFYHSPESLTSAELAEEVSIHFPTPFRQKVNSRLVPGTLDGLVVMQHISSVCPAIPPLAALKEVLLAIETVNSAILYVENGGTLYVRNAGTDVHAGASTHSVKELLELSENEREVLFPDIHASEIIMAGSDLDRFEALDLGPFSNARLITFADYAGLCEFAEEASTMVQENPHLFALTIGAASVYAEILLDGDKVSEAASEE